MTASAAAAAESDAIINQLAARYPQHDVRAMLEQVSGNSPPEMVADWLLSVGCDEEAVKKLCFDS